MNAPHSEKFIGTKEASELSGYNPDHLSRLSRSGEIDAIRVGRTWYIERESLITFLKKQGRRAKEFPGLISAKEASKKYGYSADYLARLARSGEVRGSQVGRTWLVDQSSLDSFLKLQEERREARARELARAREREYRARRQTPMHRAVHLVPQEQEPVVPGTNSFVFFYKTSARALATAFLVVVFGSLVAQAGPVAKLAAGTTSVIHGIAVGFDAAFGDIPSRFVARLDNSRADMHARSVQGAARLAHLSASLTAPELTHLDLRAAPLALTVEPRSLRSAPPALVADGKANMRRWRSDASDALAFISSPPEIMDALAGISGAIIRADVSLAYTLATAAPASARATVALVGGAGAVLADATAELPRLASALFLRTTSAPAHLAPALAQAVFDAEYTAATRFVAFTRTISDASLASITSAGELAYTITKGTQDTLRTTGTLLATAPAAVHNAYLGALGTGALALAAVQPTLTTTEQIALSTYETIHDFFTSAGRALADLLTPAPIIVLVNNTPIAPVPVATSTPLDSSASNGASPAAPPASSPNSQFVIPNSVSYPTYTTIVRGVSEDFVNQSLTSLRTELLARVSSLIQPVASQVATNVTTIQQVNMIQDLSDLIVRNGDFRGGTFDSGALTNGISVAATTGAFDTLTADDFTSGSLIATGALTSYQSATAPHFVATSTTATSTFAGGLTVGTDKLVVDSTTGYIGIGTTSPYSLLSIAGQVVGQNFMATDSSATSSFSGNFSVGGSTGAYLTGNGSGITFSGTGNHDITASAGTLRIGSNTIIGNIQALDDTVDIGTPAVRFDNIYANEVNASTIVGTLTGGNLTAETFNINSDNATADTENGYLSFERGSIIPNALLTWNAAESAKRFEFNQPLYIESADASTTLTTLDVKGVTSQTADLIRVTSSTGASLFNVGANGNVGVGTNNPSGTLDISSSASTVVNAYLGTVSAGYGNGGALNFKGAGTTIGTIKETYTNNPSGDRGLMEFIVHDGTSVSTKMVIFGNNVGIGTTTPWGQLSVNPNGITGPAFVVGSSTATNFIVTNGGNVGIGTASPADKFSNTSSNIIDENSVGTTLGSGISWTASASGYLQALSQISSGANANGLLVKISGAASTNKALSLNINGSDLFVVNGQGNVGIGTNEPSSPLQIQSPNSKTFLDIRGTGFNAANQYSDLDFTSDSSSHVYSKIRMNTVTAAYGGSLQFFTNPGPLAATASLVRMTIDETGNVGIGTTSPATSLVVQAGGTASVVNIGQLSGFTNFSGIAFTQNVSSAVSTSNYSILGDGTNTYISRPTGGFLSFRENNVDQMFIATGGNVGIGTASPGQKLDVRDGKFALTDADVAHGMTSWATTETYGLMEIDSATAGGLRVWGFGDTVGQRALVNLGILGDVDPTDTVAAITLAAGKKSGPTAQALSALETVLKIENWGTDLVTILGSGNVGIGTTSPASKLAVSGGASIGANYNVAAPTNGLIVEGKVGIGMNGASRTLDITGNVGATRSNTLVYDPTNSATFNSIISLSRTGGSLTGRNVLIDFDDVGSAVGNFGIVQHSTGLPYADFVWNQYNGSAYAETMRIDYLGNVGIGTTTPYSTLSVAGQVVGTAFVPSAATVPSNGEYLPAANTLGWATNGTARMTLTAGDNQTAALTITNLTSVAWPVANGGNVNIFSTNSSADNSGGTIGLGGWDGSNNRSHAVIFGGKENNISGNFAGYFAVSTQPNGENHTERLRITSAGSVGIGTTTPWGQLSVNPNGITGPAFVVGSSTATNFIVTNGGNVGIGTGVPLAQLSVGSGSLVDATVPVQINSASGGQAWYGVNKAGGYGLLMGFYDVPAGNFQRGGVIRMVTTDPLTFAVNNTTNAMTILSSGNVGIGTTSPYTKFAVVDGTGEMRFQNVSQNNLTVSGTNATIIADSTGGSYPGFMAKVSGTLKAQWYSDATNAVTYTTGAQIFQSGGNTEKMRIDTSGNVGIGTTSPYAQLSVATPNGATGSLSTLFAVASSTASATTTLFSISNTGTASANAIIPNGPYTTNLASYDLGATGSRWNAVWAGALNIGTSTFSIKSDSASNLGFYTAASGGGTQALTVTSAGNIGIGITNPSVSLDVNGSSRFYGIANFDGATYAAQDFKAAGVHKAYIATANAVFGGGSASDLAVDASAGNLVLGVGDAEKMRIQVTTGNVGIGDANPPSKLTVNGSLRFYNVPGGSTGGTFCYDTSTGEVAASSAGTCSGSDERLKTNIADLQNSEGLAAIAALRPVSFVWKDAAMAASQGTQLGFIAQEMQSILPELVLNDSGTTTITLVDGSKQQIPNTLSINYQKLVVPLVKAVQELDIRTGFIASAATSTVLTVDVAGNIGIGTSTPNHTLTVAGDIGATGFINTSTRSAKTDISYITASSSDDMLNQLTNLKVATYRYTIEDQSDPLRLGFIAEDAQTIAPEILSPDGKGVDLYKLATFNLAATQALAAKFDQMDTRVTSLEDRISALESGAVSSVGGTTSLASAIQSISSALNIGKLISDTFYAAQGFIDHLTAANATIGSATVPSGVTFYDSVTKQPYCFSIANGAPTTTPGICAESTESTNPFATSTQIIDNGISIGDTGTTSAPLTITLNGATPTYVPVGGTYVEPGIVVAGGSGGNIPYQVYVNGYVSDTTSPALDTSLPTTYILTYHAADGAGETATAYRSVIVKDLDSTTPPSTEQTATTSSISIESTTPVSSTATTTTDATIQSTDTATTTQSTI
ncbi:MAG: tail fiber domain-containing protein [Candidatus Paceibacterota bacterium]|jgi:hypothetical protein